MSWNVVWDEQCERIIEDYPIGDDEKLRLVNFIKVRLEEDSLEGLRTRGLGDYKNCVPWIVNHKIDGSFHRVAIVFRVLNQEEKRQIIHLAIRQLEF